MKSKTASASDWMTSFSANPDTSSSVLTLKIANLAPEFCPMICSPLWKLDDIPDISNLLVVAFHSLTLAVAPDVWPSMISLKTYDPVPIPEPAEVGASNVIVGIAV